MNIGMIGFGAMGSAMARHIMTRGGHTVFVYDIDADSLSAAREIGASPSESVGKVCQQVDLLIIMVATDEQVKAVTDEVFETGKKDILIIITSTNHPKTMQQINARAKDAGMRMIDAPVVFGLQGAVDGELVSLCGGRAEDIEAATPVLACYSKNVHHMGPVGAGQVTKTVNNMLHWSSCVANFEAISLGKRYGLHGQRLREVLLQCPAQNGTLERWDTTRFTWHEKDMDIALDLAQEADLMLPLFGQVDQLIKNIKPPQVHGLLYEKSTHYMGKDVFVPDDSPGGE